MSFIKTHTCHPFESRLACHFLDQSVQWSDGILPSILLLQRCKLLLWPVWVLSRHVRSLHPCWRDHARKMHSHVIKIEEPCLQSLGLNLGYFWVNSPLFPSDWTRHQRNIIKGPHTTKALKRRITQLSSDGILSNKMVAYENLALNSTPVSLYPKHSGWLVRRGRKNARTRRGGPWSCVLNIGMAIPLTKSESCDFLLRPEQDGSYQHLTMTGKEELEVPTH